MTVRDWEKLRDFIHGEMDTWDFFGVLRIIQGGQTVLEASRGYASIEFGIPNDMTTRFAAASVTKQFTAFAIMLLWDRGLLQPDEQADRYLPAHMRLPAGLTVHHLLSHTSGLHNNYNFEDGFYVGEDRRPYDRESFFRDWILRGPVGKPGERFDYNNSNYVLLAWIIETVSGQPYHIFLEENIFSRLGMENSSIDDGRTVLRNTAGNYMYDYGVLVRPPYTDPLFCTGAAGLVTNCDDLQKWYGCLKNRELLSARAYERYLAENRNHYCCGLERHEEYGTVKYAHGGDYLGVSAYTQYFFEEDTCIIILSNKESLDQYRFGNAAAAFLHGQPAEPVRREAGVPVPPEELRRYTGTYLPGKIWIEEKNGKLYLVRVNQKVHIELCCIGKGLFKRRYEEQQSAHRLLADGETVPSVWGYERISTEFI
ncbi:MAG: beta-lactamase family protein [Oscillospiraceae bacterium]|nr:beta-lactamase family protein [Oscillospiraceae bacterium]